MFTLSEFFHISMLQIRKSMMYIQLDDWIMTVVIIINQKIHFVLSFQQAWFTFWWYGRTQVCGKHWNGLFITCGPADATATPLSLLQKIQNALSFGYSLPGLSVKRLLLFLLLFTALQCLSFRCMEDHNNKTNHNLQNTYRINRIRTTTPIQSQCNLYFCKWQFQDKTWEQPAV